MATKVKIKIYDDSSLREILDSEYEKSSQVELCKYALLLATHILKLAQYNDMDNSILKNGYSTNESWQKGNARMHDVRQAAFKIHALAKEYEDDILKTALRTAGQAVAAGHMKEHAMVASDYAVKTINLLFPEDLDSVKHERLWQIAHLKSVKEIQ